MCCFTRLYYWAKIIEPVKPWLVSLESSQKAIYRVRSFPYGLCQLRPNELSCIIDGEFVSIFILQESKIFLNVVSKHEYVGVLAS